MMGEIETETDRGKKRLIDIKKYKQKRFECLNCKNQTFILLHSADFPFFDVLCSKCGGIYIR